MQVSFLEIYNEQIRDLLRDEGSKVRKNGGRTNSRSNMRTNGRTNDGWFPRSPGSCSRSCHAFHHFQEFVFFFRGPPARRTRIESGESSAETIDGKKIYWSCPGIGAVCDPSRIYQQSICRRATKAKAVARALNRLCPSPSSGGASSHLRWIALCCLVSQDVKHEIKRDPRGNTTVTDLTMEQVDPNDGVGVDEIMQVWHGVVVVVRHAKSGVKRSVYPIIVSACLPSSGNVSSRSPDCFDPT